MRGKKAKHLRKMARAILQSKGIPLGKGYNEYRQAMNARAWKPVLDKEGKAMIDPLDGKPLMKFEKSNPGTIACAWVWRNFYQSIKRMVKAGALVMPKENTRELH